MPLQAFPYFTSLSCCCREDSSVPAMRPVAHLDSKEMAGWAQAARLSCPVSWSDSDQRLFKTIHPMKGRSLFLRKVILNPEAKMKKRS